MKIVQIENLEAGMSLAQDIFASNDNSSPIIRKGIVLTKHLVKRLKETGVREIYVAGEDDSPKAKSKVKATIDKQLRDDAIDSLENLFDIATSLRQEEIHSASAQIVKKIDNVVDGLVGSLLGEKDALVNINNLKSFDDYTFHHSLSVAVLSLSLGQHLGYDERELNDLGVCAMMHDIGKTAIPVDMIRKPSKLSNSEFDLIKTHSFSGYQYLLQTKTGTEKMWDGVLHHHEKVDGTGYPSGLKGDDIPEWSRIISVADVYDALTSTRPYRSPMQPADAVEYLMGGIGSSFDYDIVSGLVQRVDLYPVGSLLELSNGQFATVLNNENQMRPVVLISDTGEIMDLYRDRQCLSIVVKKVISNNTAA